MSDKIDRLADIRKSAENIRTCLDMIADIPSPAERTDVLARNLHILNLPWFQDVELLLAEIDRLNAEGVPGVMHEVDKSFYDLTVKERDFERTKVDRLTEENEKLRELARGYQSSCHRLEDKLARLPDPPEVNGIPLGSTFSDVSGEYEVIDRPVWLDGPSCYVQATRTPEGVEVNYPVTSLRLWIKEGK